MVSHRKPSYAPTYSSPSSNNTTTIKTLTSWPTSWSTLSTLLSIKALVTCKLSKISCRIRCRNRACRAKVVSRIFSQDSTMVKMRLSTTITHRQSNRTCLLDIKMTRRALLIMRLPIVTFSATKKKNTKSIL